MAITNFDEMGDLLRAQTQGWVEELASRLNVQLYGPPPYPAPRPTLADVCAKHFPRLAAVVSYGRRMQEMTAAARYRIGVAVIGYDPAPNDDEER